MFCDVGGIYGSVCMIDKGLGFDICVYIDYMVEIKCCYDVF